MKKLSAFMLSFVLVLEAAFCLPFTAFANDAPMRTVMLYLVGSNLEDDGSSATTDLLECLNSDYNENLNLIVITGGANKWHLGKKYLSGTEKISSQYNQIWKLEGKQSADGHGMMTLLEPTGLAETGTKLMTESAVLTDFVDYCYENYPADIYDVILWNHGGGPASGFGYDSREYAYNALELSDLTEAFQNTALIEDGNKFEIMDFDACEMSSVEIVATLGEFAENMVLSPETEPGDGQEYSQWLNAVNEDPFMDGYALGTKIVDAYEYFYTEVDPCSCVTLSVINVANFKERLLSDLYSLDEKLISEAKTVGRRNNRYNFYDELYSIQNSIGYAYGEANLYDLGNLAGALSVPQSEVNNCTAQQINNAQNIYTSVALDILSVLRDNDNSGDDVIYAFGDDSMNKTIAGGYLRDANGELVWAEDYVQLQVYPSGISIYIGHDSYAYLVDFVRQMITCSRLVTDPEIQDYLEQRAIAAAYYGLIIKAGSTVSKLANAGAKHINYRQVKQNWEKSYYWPATAEPVIDYLVQLGEFEDMQEAEDFLSVIVAQQSKEVVSKDKVAVRKILNEDDTADSYQVTVSNTSAQAFMSVNSAVDLTCSENDETQKIIEYIYGPYPSYLLFSDGIGFTTSVTEGELDFADYVEDYNDSYVQINQRLYSSTSSVWKVPEAATTCFALYDDDGNAHPADIHYTDKSYESAYIPIVIYEPQDGEVAAAYDANIIISKTDGVWSVEGLTFDDEDKADRSYFPMDSDFFEGLRFAPSTKLIDDVYEYESFIPISTFDDIDITKDCWGISFGDVSFDELEDIEFVDSHFFVSDVYGYRISLNDSFEAADKAAESGDYTLDINRAEVLVELAIYDGYEQRPAVDVTIDGEYLTEDEDYKLYYFGFTQPGEAYFALLGLGDYTGIKYVDFEIVTGWYKLDGIWYYFDSEGFAATGWQKINNKWYYFNDDYEMQTGWQYIDNAWYYLNPDGAMRTGWFNDGGYWYYLGASGAMKTGWLRSNGKWYFLGSSGAMKTGWVKDAGKWYYLEANGAMRTASLDYKVKTYMFNSSGVCINP